MVCPKCGTSYLGDTCPSCSAKCKMPLDVMCAQLVDKNGNHIDANELASAYLSVHAIKTFFKKYTNYPAGEIDELARYIDKMDGNDCGFVEAAAIKKKLESNGIPAHTAFAPQRPAYDLPKKSRSYAAPEEPAPAVCSKPDKPLSKHQRIKENKQNGVACCPKCGSTSITANKKGFSFVKGGLGATVGSFIPLGAIIGLGAGNLGSKKLIVTCLNCGHRWKV